MIVKFFKFGKGGSKPCIDYLLGKDRDREHARVLSGDVDLTADLIDSSRFTKKYTAGCLSFYEHDLRPEQKQQIMDDFEKCLFPGMTKDQYRILWVEHQDKINLDTGETRLELNFLIPNVEVNSGKRLQPFYAAADLDRVECFKQITNHIHALYDPDDPAHRQATKVAKALPTNGKELKATLEIEAALAIGEGIISDRQSLVQWLKEIGLEVTRQTPKSVSVKHKDDAENAGQVDHLQENWAKPMPAFPVEDGSVAGVLEDESGKFNLNSLVNNEGQVNENAKAWFERILVRVGLPAQLSEAVIDWQDSDDQPLGSMGAEASYYQGMANASLPPNAKFHDVAELKQIRGFDTGKDQLIAPYVTAIPSHDSKVNINTASAFLLASLDEKLDVNAVKQAVEQQQANLKHFESVSDLWVLSPFSEVSEEKKED